MTNETAEQNRFDGWAILELFGHQKYAGHEYAGHVTTQVFGTTCMFRLDVPGLEERDYVTKYAEFIEEKGRAPAGSTVKMGSTQPYTKLFGVGAIYCITPCTEEAAKKAVEQLQPRPLTLVSVPADKALDAPDGEFKCCGGSPRLGHAMGCQSDEESDT